MKHITFDGIDCKHLQYMRQSGSWVCLRDFDDLKHVDTCVKCRFDYKRRIEDRIMAERKLRHYG